MQCGGCKNTALYLNYSFLENNNINAKIYIHVVFYHLPFPIILQTTEDFPFFAATNLNFRRPDIVCVL